MRYLTTLFILLLAGIALAQPPLSGDLSGSLGPGSYTVVGDCYVPAGLTLTIQPGTSLLYTGHYFLFVNGQLIANGTEADSIFFMRQQPDSTFRHGGIQLLPGSSTDNQLSYCRIDGANNRDFPNIFGGAILCWGSGLTIHHSRITDCHAEFGAGIYVIDSQASVSDCEISNCYAVSTGAGIYTINSQIVISDCIITHNIADLVGGICMYNNPNAEVYNCVIAYNVATSAAT
ncbi:MAG: right-handed parallel beta-helix repeat-containing protein [bacterium]|nr:right-handed parallel beta-helix repeat-containing protein [bacterium]